MSSVHQYIESYHPGYLRRLAIGGARLIGNAYQQFDYHRRLARHTANLQSIGNDMPPIGSRFSRSRSRTAVGFPITPSYTGARGRARGRTGVSGSASMSTASRARSAPSRRSRSSRRSSVGPRIHFNRLLLRNYARQPRITTASNRVAGGYFRRARRSKISKFQNKHGVVSKYEFGSSLSDPECVYIGHGINANQLIETVARCLVKSLYTKHGWEIPSFSEPIPLSGSDVHFIQLETYASTVTPAYTLTNTANIVSGDTWEGAVNRLLTVMTPLASDKRRWVSISLFDGSNAGADRVMLAKIMLSAFDMRFSFASMLKIQNVTEAATGADANDELTTNVEANPLHGKEYVSTEWKNGFELFWRPGVAIVTWDGFFVDASTGLIRTTATDSTPAAGTYNDFKKPPPDFVFRATKSAKVLIQPGEIKTSKIIFRTRIMFQNMMEKTSDAWLNYSITTNPVIDFGFAKMVALEKLLDSRLASDANCTIQFEVDQTLKVMGRQIPRGTMPAINIQ